LLFRARKIGSNGHELGFVGEITESNPQWLETIWQQGALPVVSSLALGSDGEYYNINADQMAAACALASRAHALIFLTDVPGVWNRDHVLLARLTRPEVARLVESAAVGGGMLPKLDACLRALEGGVPRVCILGAREAHKLPAVLAARAQIGTELVAA
jgi:acetylglutamate kinase